MAPAVLAWSPVIIFTRIPALWHVATAWAASGRGGSIIPLEAQEHQTFGDIVMPNGSRTRWHRFSRQRQDSQALGGHLVRLADGFLLESIGPSSPVWQ